MFRTVLLSIIRSLNTVFTVIDICRTEILKMGKITSVCVCVYIQCVSRLEDITAGSDFLGPCYQKSSCKHVSDFGRLRSYGQF